MELNEKEVKQEDNTAEQVTEKPAAAENAGDEAIVQDEQLEKIISRKKKKLPKAVKIVIVLVILALIGTGVFMYLKKVSSTPPSIATIKASKGDIEQTIDTSGTVESKNEKIYYANTTAQVVSVNLVKGDTVSAGQMLLTYDTSSLELAKKKADLTAQATDATLNEQLETNNKNVNDFIMSSLSLSSNEAQIADLEAKINQVYCMIASNTKWVNDTGAQYQKDISALETEKAGISNNQSRVDEINAEIQKKKDEIKSHDNTDLNEYLRQGQDQLTKLQSSKSESKSKKDTAENGIITDTKKYEIATNKELDAVTKQEADDNLEKAKAGVAADFNGVVKDVKAVQGMTAAPGTELFTVDDTDHVKVDIQVSKYDLSNIKIGQSVDLTIANTKYKGKVSKVNHVAEKNASGASVVTAEIDVIDPDSSIFIGVDAKCVIHVKKVSQAVILPVEAVNADKDGSYCYVIRNGVVKKQTVETGISSDTYVEILKGINEGDNVISDTSLTVEDGMKATAVPSSETATEGSTEGSAESTAASAAAE